MQLKQNEWSVQWQNLRHDGCDQSGATQQHFLNFFLKPYDAGIFKNKVVLDAGCGGGDKLFFLSALARRVIGVDLNTQSVVAQRIQDQGCCNVEFIEADLAELKLPEQVDILISDGVIHHTVDPDRTFANLKSLVKPGGLMMVMVYAQEGNWVNQHILNKIFAITRAWPYILKRWLAVFLARCLRGYGRVICFCRITGLPFYRYLHDYFLGMSFSMNVLDIYDQINAPLVYYIARQDIERWFQDDFEDVNIFHEKGVTWVANGRKK
ncbi:MAG: class I SAM-dependent methyltransferase [Candidatus Omnitrophica bacterium]|nr:class I SAM-dependent methyltransferase [Candidatus Omnitrophota bacterium]